MRHDLILMFLEIIYDDSIETFLSFIDVIRVVSTVISRDYDFTRINGKSVKQSFIADHFFDQ